MLNYNFNAPQASWGYRCCVGRGAAHGRGAGSRKLALPWRFVVLGAPVLRQREAAARAGPGKQL